MIYLNMFDIGKFVRRIMTLCLMVVMMPSMVHATNVPLDDDEDEYTIKTFGDLDGDKDVGVSDIMLLVQYLLTQDENLVEKEEADIFEDGEISINDVMMLVDIVMGGDVSKPVYVPLF